MRIGCRRMDFWVYICLTIRPIVAKNGGYQFLDGFPPFQFVCSRLYMSFVLYFIGIQIAQIAQIMSVLLTPRMKTNLGTAGRTPWITTTFLISIKTAVAMVETTRHGWVIFPSRSTTYLDKEWNAAPSTFQQRPIVPTKTQNSRIISGRAIKTIPKISSRHPSGTTTHFIQTFQQMPVSMGKYSRL